MKAVSILLVAALLAGAHAEGSENGKQVCYTAANIQTLEAQVSVAKGEVKALQAQLDEQQQQPNGVISVAAMASQMGSVMRNVIEEKLMQTELDDQFQEKLAQTFGSVSAFSKNVMEQATALDYRAHLSTLSDKYSTHVAPHVATATKIAQPHLDQYVQPALDKASAQLVPHLATAKETASKHYKTLETDVMPLLKAKGSQAYEHVSGLSSLSFEAMLDKVMAPVFALIANAAPKHANVLPSSPLDRLLLLVVVVIALYTSFRAAWVLLKIALKTTCVGAKITMLITKLALVWPVRLVLRILNFLLWISTGFYCCGLFHSKSVQKKDNQTAKGDSNKKAEEKGKKVTLEEITALLMEAQKKKKLDDAVKQACKLCKSGKAFSAPKNLEGKIVTADVLKGALKKVGVDSKGLL